MTVEPGFGAGVIQRKMRKVDHIRKVDHVILVIGDARKYSSSHQHLTLTSCWEVKSRSPLQTEPGSETAYLRSHSRRQKRTYGWNDGKHGNIGHTRTGTISHGYTDKVPLSPKSSEIELLS